MNVKLSLYRDIHAIIELAELRLIVCCITSRATVSLHSWTARDPSAALIMNRRQLPPLRQHPLLLPSGSQP